MQRLLRAVDGFPGKRKVNYSQRYGFGYLRGDLKIYFDECKAEIIGRILRNVCFL